MEVDLTVKYEDVGTFEGMDGMSHAIFGRVWAMTLGVPEKTVPKPLHRERKKRQKEKGENRERKEGEQKGEERETAPVGIIATVAAAVPSGGRSEEERECGVEGAEKHAATSRRRCRRRRPHPESPSSPVQGEELSHHCSAAATVGSPCCRLRTESVREEGEALPSRPWLSPRVPVTAASEFVAVKQSTHRGEAVQARQSAHRGEAVQATVKSPSMKLQPLYLWSPETAVGAATFLDCLSQVALSELPFHYCRLCSEPLIVASIVVMAAARFSRSSLAWIEVRLLHVGEFKLLLWVRTPWSCDCDCYQCRAERKRVPVTCLVYSFDLLR
ncbi:uncharacterized protein DS421_12g376210 [Arachis hypogaea]|nr:uncharacterized protein DS421_12g376210 [Arachis hypogaea]